MNKYSTLGADLFAGIEQPTGHIRVPKEVCYKKEPTAIFERVFIGPKETVILGTNFAVMEIMYLQLTKKTIVIGFIPAEVVFQVVLLTSFRVIDSESVKVVQQKEEVYSCMVLKIRLHIIL
ncbi:hypothetical protein [Legionella qingyii]|nr:hypothetical protein [Legionella qingyii]